MSRLERKLLTALGLSILVVLASVLAASAAGPVNPTQAQWTAPTTNDDPPIFSPLTDLASYRVYVAAGATQPVFPGAAWGVIQIVPAATPNPAPNTIVNMTLPIIPTDGQKYALITAVDTAGNESKASPVVPFMVNRQAPSPPSGVTLQ